MSKTRPTLARAYGSPRNHLLDLTATTPTTRCGRDATLMARWSPADARVDSKPRPICADCR